MSGIDSNTKLMLHGNGVDASTTFKDESPSAHGNAAVTATVEVDTAQSKWGGASMEFDGDSGLLVFPGSTDFDICASAADSWTIDFQIRFAAVGGEEDILVHVEDVNNRWRLIHTAATGWNFQLVDGGVTKITMTVGAGGAIADTNWHHVALIKKEDDYGVYVDGTQYSHAIGDADTDSQTGAELIIGSYYNKSQNFFDGHIDELRIQHSNYFNASPNATPDDTITEPTAAYTWDTKGGGLAVGHGPHIYYRKPKAFLWVPHWYQRSTIKGTE